MAKEKAEKAVVCLCGCGTELANKKSSFAPGHDMTVKGRINTNIKEGKKNLFTGCSKPCVEYVKEKWSTIVSGLIDNNAGKAFKGKTFASDEEKVAAIQENIDRYRDQLGV